MLALLLVAKRFGNHLKLHIALWRKLGLQSLSKTIASGAPTHLLLYLVSMDSAVKTLKAAPEAIRSCERALLVNV
jgi:hypothetical protein